MTDEEDQQGVSVFVETAEKFKRKLQRYGVPYRNVFFVITICLITNLLSFKCSPIHFPMHFKVCTEVL